MSARTTVAAILITQFLFTNSCFAGKKGPHLGIKLSAKKYGDAWNSGSLSAIHGVATPDFAAQFDRMPPDAFAELPRSASKGKVISSSKGRGSGTLTVSTDQGVMTLQMVGKGFHWQVADIYKTGDDGYPISVKNYMDVSLTAGEFMKNLKENGGDSFHYAASANFRNAFAELSEQDINRVREFLPQVKFKTHPYIELRDSWARIHVQMPNGQPGDKVTFSMVREGTWRVDDYIIDSRTTKIASFRNALPAIASLTALGKFVNDPAAVEPASFTAPGELRDALNEIRYVKPFPIPQGEKMVGLEIAGDGSKAIVQYPSRTVQITICKTTQGMALASMDVKIGEKWASAASLLTMQSKFASNPFKSLLSFGTTAKAVVKNKTEASTLAAVSAVVQSPKPATPNRQASTSFKPATPAVEEVATPVASANTEAQSEAVQVSHIQPQTVPAQPTFNPQGNVRQQSQPQRRGLNLFRRRR